VTIDRDAVRFAHPLFAQGVATLASPAELRAAHQDLAAATPSPDARARHLAAIVPYYANFYLERHDFHGIFVHDSSTISYLLAPEHFSWVEYPIRVDCGNSFCRGRTQTAIHVSDHESPWNERRATRILTQVDSGAVVALELERLRG